MPKFAFARRCATLVAGAVLMAACSGESPTAFTDHAGDLLWTIHAEIGAVTLAVGGTQQLSATVRLASGAIATNAPAVTYTSADPLNVRVTSSGLLTGLGVTSAPSAVVASVTSQGQTLTDTVWVAVTATARPIKTFSLHGGQVQIPQGGSIAVPLTVTDSSNNTLFNLAIKYTSLNPNILNISYGYINGYVKGTTKFVASTMSYGVLRADTVDLSVVNPMNVTVYCYNRASAGYDFNVSTIIIGVGGSAVFANYTGGALSITFSSGVENIPNGNIVNAGSYSFTTRTFPVAGTYPFTNQNGAPGKVVVLPN